MTTGVEDTTLELTYFTDPLCCWSWGMQPHLDNLLAHYQHHITIKYVMGGLLPSWTNFIDQANAVSRPAQMGPVWMHVAQLTHRPINYHLWMKDPPASSYPACVAVKCAQLQSTEAGVRLFRKLQEAAMQNGQNIGNAEIIKSVAGKLSHDFPSFDYMQFTVDFLSGRGIPAFREDLSMVAARAITRFPSLLIESSGKKGILIPGYRTLDGLISAIGQAFPTSDRQAERDKIEKTVHGHEL